MSSKKLGKYEIRGSLGRGAFAEVLLAWHPVLEAPRALKVPFDQSPDKTARLASEARTQARLTHPHICQVYDTDEADGTFFIVMEYASGGSLRRTLKDGPVAVGMVVAWIAQAAEALSYAHSRGVVHRDIKPDNLLLSEDGAIKVADFGLARVLQPDEEARTRAGTIQYMAPEHLKGEVTFLSDLWSLGVVFYELLTGRLPFRAESQWALASRIMIGEAEPIAEGRPDLPEPLAAALGGLLERDPARRTPDAAALLKEVRAVQRLLQREPALLSGPPAQAEAPSTLRPSEAATVPVHEWPQGRGGPSRTGSVSPDLLLPLQLAWRAEIGSAMVAPPVVSNGLVLVVTSGGELVMLEEGWGGEEARIKLAGSFAAAPSVLGGSAYLGGYGGRLFAVDIAERKVSWEVDLGAPSVATAAASEDFLFVPLMDGRLLRLSRSDGRIAGSFRADGPLASAPLLVEDLVVVGSRDGNIYGLARGDLAERWRFEAEGWIDGGPAASGAAVVAGSFGGTVVALEASTGLLRWQGRLPCWVAAGPALDKATAFVLAFDGTLAALSLEDGSELWRVRSRGRFLGGPALAGELLVTAGAEGLVTARSTSDGLERWASELEGECLGGPTVAGRSLYVALREGVLLAFR